MVLTLKILTHISLFQAVDIDLKEAEQLIGRRIALGDDINQIDNNGETPLMAAIGMGNIAMITALLKCGADCNIVSRVSTPDNVFIEKTGLSIAASCENHEIIRLLLGIH